MTHNIDIHKRWYLLLIKDKSHYTSFHIASPYVMLTTSPATGKLRENESIGLMNFEHQQAS